jgi:Ca2+-transporting ATPase
MDANSVPETDLATERPVDTVFVNDAQPNVVDSPPASSDDDTNDVKHLMMAADEAPPRVEVPQAFVSEDYPISMPVLIETIERRDMQRFELVFGGLDGFSAKIKSNVESGIDSSSVATRKELLGENVLQKKEPVTFLEMLIDACSDRVIQILTVASIISVIFGLTLPNAHTGEVDRKTGWIEGTAIIISVLVVVLTGSIQNYNKAKKFEEMERAQSVKQVSVMRDGREQTIESSELVVGDVMVLETGMEMVCDAIYISGADLKTNESPITGEPDLIEKSSEKDVFIISGTSIEEGTGVVMVAAVGPNSFQGQMARALDADSGETPLQEHLTELGDNIGQVGLSGAVLLCVALCIKEIILITTQDREATASHFLSFVIIAITLIAVAIPEGLPLAVTIALAFSMNAMTEQQCMVRVLASCETMGAATAVCSDKTGTLTTNVMTVVQTLLAELEFVIDGYGLAPRTDNVKIYDRDNMNTIDAITATVDQLCTSLAVNSTARQQINECGEKVWVGNKTEAGILGLVMRLGRDFMELRAIYAGAQHKQYPFSSAKKRMTTLVRDKTGITAHTKGASEIILAACSQYIDERGDVVPLTDAKRELFNTIIVDMASQGNRTIGVAYQRCPFEDFPADEPDLDYVFLGVLGIQDPIRLEVPAAVEKCNSAHLVVRMVTGDNINTAMAISKKCGLFDPEQHVAMTGPDFREMYRTDRQQLVDLLPRLRVLARSSPNDKYVLVGLLQDELGDVVGVTGDGTNDAPALKLADVGFAMNTGTDIAKGAADMVLLDDNFATVVTAIKWGRAVNDNIKKFLQYQLAINFAGVGMTVVGSLASETSKEPLAAVQLLWLNLIMDTLAALALATELPEERSLTRLPVYKQAPLVSNHMRIFIGVHGSYQLLMILLVLFLGASWFHTSESYASCHEVGGHVNKDGYCVQGRVHSTMLFNIFIWFQIFNVFNARKIYGEINCFEGIFSRSRTLLCVFGVVAGLQVIAVELCGDFLKTTQLNWWRWLICVGFGATEMILGLIVRLVPVKDYVPTKEEILEARRKEKEEEQKAKDEAAAAEAAVAGTEMKTQSEEAPARRKSAAAEEVHVEPLKRRGTFVHGDSSLKRSMSIRKVH